MAVGKFGNALDAIAYASIDSANDLLTVCDVNGDDLGTGPEDKKIAAVEFIKRSLGSADVSWMTTASTFSSIDQAADWIIFYDNSSTSFRKMQANTFFSKTLAGSNIAAFSSFTNLTEVDPAADKFAIWDNSLVTWKLITASELLNKILSYTSTNVTATPTTVTAAQSGQRFTNIGASQVIEFDLPSATVGLRYTFNRIANYAIRLDPNGSEIISDGGAGKYLEITTRGQLNIECIAAGTYEVTGGSAIYTFEV